MANPNIKSIVFEVFSPTDPYQPSDPYRGEVISLAVRDIVVPATVH